MRPVGCGEEAGGLGDVEDEGVGGQGAALAARGGRSVAAARRRTVSGAASARCGREEEGGGVAGVGGEGAGGQGEDVDADEAEAVVAAAEVAFEDGRDLPAGAAEGDVVGERDVAWRRWGRSAAAALAAEEAGGAGVAVAGLGVQRLHAGEEGGGDGEADEEGGELERVAAPVAEEGGEGRDHARRPGAEGGAGVGEGGEAAAVGDEQEAGAGVARRARGGAP